MSGRGAPAEDVDLTVDQQRRIDHLFAQLSGLGFYELLGIAQTADKKEVKRAYHERVMELHPDRFWGKRLGTFKPKMEAIVRRLTEAHDALCSPEARAGYDEELRARRASAVEPRERAAVDPDQAPPSSRARPSERLPVDDNARRQALAARLAHGRITPAIGMKPVGPMPTPASSMRPTPVSGIMPVATTVTKLRELLSRHKRRPLEGADLALFEQLRDEFARVFVAAQRLTLLEGQTPRRSLRVTCTQKVALTMSGVVHRTATLDLSPGGLSVLLGTMPAMGAPCELQIDTLPEPIHVRARTASVARHGAFGSTFRVSVAFDSMSTSDAGRIEVLVLEHALANLKL